MAASALLEDALEFGALGYLPGAPAADLTMSPLLLSRAARRPAGTEDGKDQGGHALHVEYQSGRGAVLFELRPASVAEPPGPQVEPILETFVPVPSLDVPVPQSVDQPVDVLKIFDISVPEQVIDVLKIISQENIPQRRGWWNSWWMCQRPSSTSSTRGRRERSWHCTRTQLATRGSSALGHRRSTIPMIYVWWAVLFLQFRFYPHLPRPVSSDLTTYLQGDD